MTDAAFAPRSATAADQAALAALARRAYGKWVAVIGAEPQPMAADYGEILRDYQVWLVDGADGLAASLILQPRDGYLLVWSVAVDPAQQGAGLGKKLMGFAEQEAKRQGFGEIRLYTNVKFEANRALYKRLGYAETHFEKIGERTAVHMRKDLGG